MKPAVKLQVRCSFILKLEITLNPNLVSKMETPMTADDLSVRHELARPLNVSRLKNSKKLMRPFKVFALLFSFSIISLLFSF